MSKFWVGLLILCSVAAWAHARQVGVSNPDSKDKLPTHGRVVFLGNSITYAGNYIHHFTTAVLLKGNIQNLEIFNLGLPSETVSGLSEDGHAEGEFPRPNLHDRLGKVLDTLSPDLVIACYGINDGIYLPFDQYRFEQFVDGIERLHREVTRKGARIILMTPPVFDPARDEAYADVIHRYANWLIRQRAERGWEIIDIHWPMLEFLTENRSVDNSFYLAKDGIHPGEIGHWLMARVLLRNFEVMAGALPRDPETFFNSHSEGGSLLGLTAKSINLSRDYWLDKIGHERPGLTPALPDEEFWKQNDQIGAKIREKLVQIQGLP
jgi:lysophospholipase L1-like esterase